MPELSLHKIIAMAKIIPLFAEEELWEFWAARVAGSGLPLIPPAKKKLLKNDTPFEKEVRRFNRLIKELNEYESHFKRQEKLKEEYDRLCHTRLIPVLMNLARAKY